MKFDCKKIIVIVIISVTAINGKAQTTNKTDNFYWSSKVWGILKYYHPDAKKNKVDMDSCLLFCLNKNFNNLQPYNISNELLKIFYKNNTASTCFNSEKLPKQFDWLLQPNDYLTEIQKSYLANLILCNDTLMPNYYYAFNKYRGPGFSEEKQYPDKKYNDTALIDIKLLGIFRLWNAINMYSPYRNYYISNSAWDSVLQNSIQSVLKSNISLLEYNFVINRMLIALRDGHGYVFSKERFKFVGNYYMPIKIKCIKGVYYVAQIIDKNKCGNIAVGDKIIAMDNQTVEEKVLDYTNIVPAYLPDVKKAIIVDLLNGTKNKTSFIKVIDKNNQSLVVKTRNFGVGMYFIKMTPVPYKKISEKTSYINFSLLSAKKADNYLAKSMNAEKLILDLRGYPRGSTEDLLYKYLFPSNKTNKIRTYWVADMKTPCKFYTDSDSVASKQRQNSTIFSGKIIVLVDYNTLSLSEIIVMELQRLPNIFVMGTDTKGAIGGMFGVPIPFGITANFTGTLELYPDKVINTPQVRLNKTIDVDKMEALTKDIILEAAIAE